MEKPLSITKFVGFGFVIYYYIDSFCLVVSRIHTHSYKNYPLFFLLYVKEKNYALARSRNHRARIRRHHSEV